MGVAAIGMCGIEQSLSTLIKWRSGQILFDDGACRITIDNSALPPDDCAAQIAAWIQELQRA